MMTCLKEKQKESAEIAKALAEFKARGGKVKKYRLGESGAKPLRYSRKHNKDSIK